ncbi:MAG: hypothetical protein ABI600_16620 [Luteolibacter sp.]
MKTTSNTFRGSRIALLATIIAGSLALTQHSYAKAGATDPIPGTSKSGLSTGGGGGGGGGKSSTPVVAPTPAPAPQAIVTATLNFTAAAQVNGVIPTCTGSYHIDPYYPTLSLMTVDVRTDSVNVPDGTQLYVTVNGTGGTLYPFTSNVILITAQSGTCSHSVYVTPGTTITSVVISDAFGTVISAGN